MEKQTFFFLLLMTKCIYYVFQLKSERVKKKKIISILKCIRFMYTFLGIQLTNNSHCSNLFEFK
jgi:hypothetical protein